MKNKIYKLSVNLTEEQHGKIKLMALLQRKSIKQTVLDAIGFYAEKNREFQDKDTIIRNMKHRMHRMEYDAHDNKDK